MPRLLKMSSAIMLLVIAVIAGLFNNPAVAGPGPIPYWSPLGLDLPKTINLYGVYTVDGLNSAWLAGSYGTIGSVMRITHVGYNQWSVVESFEFRAPVRAIVAIAPDNIWAVGDNGLILHRDAGGWAEMPNPLPNADLRTIQMFGNGSEGWAAGTSGPNGEPPAMLHLLNGRWQLYSYYTDPAPRALHFGAGGVGYAVAGFRGWRYSGDNWQDDAVPCRPSGYSCSTDLNDVRAINADEAWAVGADNPVLLTGFRPNALVMHRSAGQWQPAPISDVGLPHPEESSLNAISLGPDGTSALAVGWQKLNPDGPQLALAALYVDPKIGGIGWVLSSISYVEGALNAVSHADGQHAIAVGDGGLVMAYGYGGDYGTPFPTAVSTAPTYTPSPTATYSGIGTPTATETTTAVPTFIATPTVTPPNGKLPTDRVDDPHDPNAAYFPETGHTLGSGFLQYWLAKGGLEQFGYPLTEPFMENDPATGTPYKVQYFERARFEAHPENAAPYDVLLGLLGRTITTNRSAEAPFQPAAPLSTPGSIYFAATSHTVPAEFAAYWQDHGGLPVYGYPISEAFQEVSPTDGKPYLVQYFERNRFEYHPELGEQYRVSLGLLGVQVLKERGWLR